MEPFWSYKNCLKPSTRHDLHGFWSAFSPVPINVSQRSTWCMSPFHSAVQVSYYKTEAFARTGVKFLCAPWNDSWLCWYIAIHRKITSRLHGCVHAWHHPLQYYSILVQANLLKFVKHNIGLFSSICTPGNFVIFLIHIVWTKSLLFFSNLLKFVKHNIGLFSNICIPREFCYLFNSLDEVTVVFQKFSHQLELSDLI